MARDCWHSKEACLKSFSEGTEKISDRVDLDVVQGSLLLDAWGRPAKGLCVCVLMFRQHEYLLESKTKTNKNKKNIGTS